MHRRTGDVRSVLEKYGPDTKLSKQEELIVLQLLLDKPGIFLMEIQQELYDATGTWVDCSTLSRTAKQNLIKGIFLMEIQQELYDATSTWVDCSTLSRTAKRNLINN